MSIKQILALAVIAVGILLNLKLQDAMALAGSPDGQREERHAGSSALSPWDRSDRVIPDGSPAATAADRATGHQRNRTGDPLLAGTQQQKKATPPVYESDCE